MRKRHVPVVLLLLISLIAFVLMSRGYIGSLVHPLPFEGPYYGTIIDALNGNPIENAMVKADWWCYDSPDPHLGNYWVHFSVTSDKNGHYKIKEPNHRGGWFGGSFTLSVHAKGYIPAVLVLMPNGPPLPPSTKAYPFIDTRAYASLPASLDIQLNPFRHVLLEALEAENAQYRWKAAEELGKIGSGAKFAVGPLTDKLKDKDATVRKYSAEALGKIGYNAKGAVLALIATLDDEDESVRLKAIDALGDIGIADDDILSALIKLLTANDNSVRTHAVRCLAKLGPKAKAAVPILKDMLRQRGISKYFRGDVEFALKKIDPDTIKHISTQ
jgi:hypothetical protein